MEVYKQIKKDFFNLFAIILVFSVLLNGLGFSIDDTDKDGFNRSGVSLITDYGTGLQYLYKGGALIPRIGANGIQVRVNDGKTNR